MSGKVYLVGAGPGDPNLITVKGLKAIQEADVVIYDRLASPRLLKNMKSDAEKIYVGKKPDRHTFSQEEINRLLVKKANRGKVVTRLKGGDPFIFGRGGEEAEVLIKEGIPFEIVPGITSAIAVPAYAGIPVTHREFNSSFAVVTGHERPDKEDSSIRWEQLSTATETLIFLMGVSNLPFIVEKLQKYGRSPDTPIALVRWGTRMEQETLTGKLDDIVQKVEENQFRSPAVIVVGEVVRLREKLQWFEKKPLFGKRILVTRARSQNSSLSEKIEAFGGEAIEFPVIRTEQPARMQAFDQALDQLPQYDWVIFTSANGVESFFTRLSEREIDIRQLKAKIAAIGPKTAETLKIRGLRMDLLPDRYQAEDLLGQLKEKVKKGEHILLPRANIAREVLPNGLRQMGCQVTDVDAYDTCIDAPNADEIRDLIRKGKIDFITFTSSSTVKNFMQAIQLQPEDLSHIRIACIGPITAATVKNFGLTVDILADEYTVDGLFEAIIRYLSGGE